MHEIVSEAAARQVGELEKFARESEAFSEAETVELVRWFNWRTTRLLDADLAALRGLEALEERPGEPFVATWADVVCAGAAVHSRLATAFHRLEHIGVLERRGLGPNATRFRLIRPAGTREAVAA
jgi:hypothetical protein